VEDRGPGQPMDIGTTEVALSKNRRVEVEIVP
jgi:outer membrane protein OmpA-like peptidoglycan-associated protein